MTESFLQKKNLPIFQNLLNSPSSYYLNHFQSMKNNESLDMHNNLLEIPKPI